MQAAGSRQLRTLTAAHSPLAVHDSSLLTAVVTPTENVKLGASDMETQAEQCSRPAPHWTQPAVRRSQTEQRKGRTSQHWRWRTLPTVRLSGEPRKLQIRQRRMF